MLKHRGEPVGQVDLRGRVPVGNAALPAYRQIGQVSNVYTHSHTPATYTSANVSVA